MSISNDLDPASWLVHGGRDGGQGAALNVPITPASNFVDAQGERTYSRVEGTRAWEALEDVVGGLEGGLSVAFASGMGAIAAVFSLLPKDAKIAIPADCYRAVSQLAEAGVVGAGWQVHTLDGADTVAWVAACAEMDLIWLESPSNPQLVLNDLVQIGATPRRAGSLLVVDNTFATPLLQRPLARGADISVQSATKYLGGHSDLLGGVATAKSDALAERLRQARTLRGATPGALEVFLTLRGMRTLAVRLERSQANALLLAQRLQAHDAVSRVRYPGLPSHPQHALAKAQLDGFGSIVSFELHGGAAAADAACRAARLITHATSLGAVESTMERRAAVPGQGDLPPSLIRLSVGIENGEDLWRDLAQALAAGESARTGTS
ncbi:MAG: PLP-dependent transferase [Pseudomonadota bacterium]